VFQCHNDYLKLSAQLGFDAERISEDALVDRHRSEADTQNKAREQLKKFRA
jgi:lysylphosphatidylglycerol synthetase-like protein (DUF2156 family)